MNLIPFTRTQHGVSFILKGRPRTIANATPNFSAVLAALIEGNAKALETLCDIPSFIAKITKGNVQISDDEVRFRGEKVPEYLATRILAYQREGIPVDAMCAFAEKLMSNPTEDVRTDMYKWLEKGNMPIYADGDFLAYKVVTKEFYSLYDRKTFQGVGEVVKLDRAKCDANRDVTCSSGLHFCSYDYLPRFGGMDENSNRIIIVKINPANVVAIPTDYNLTKGRCCEFEVTETVPIDEIKSRFGSSTYVAPVTITVTITDDVVWTEEDSWTEENDSYENNEETTEVEVTTKGFEREGKFYSNDAVIDAVEEHGAVEASKRLGVPRSTLGGWYKRATA